MKSMKEILDRIEELPTLPQVVTKIMQLVENPRTSAMEITKVISLDPALTVKILKLVNSAYYGFPKKIRTITHAIMILGFEDVKNIALSVSVFDIFKNPPENNPEFNRTAFWQHSIAVGVCAKLLARRVRFKNPEEAFIAGLLHDIGKIVLDQFFHDHFAKVINSVETDNILFVNAERRFAEMDHAEIGKELGNRWQLPIPVLECIGYHHEPAGRGRHNLLVSLVHAADVFVRIQKIGSGWDRQIPQLRKEAWAQLNIPPDKLAQVYVELHEEVEKAGEFLKLARGQSEESAE